MNWAKEAVTSYISDAQKHPGVSFENIDKVKDLKTELDNNQWDNASKKALELGWNFNDFLMSDDVKKKFDDQKSGENINHTFELYKKHGVNPDLAQALISKGYTDLYEKGIADPKINEYLSKNGALTFHNPTSNQLFFIKDNQPFLAEQGFEHFHPLYGRSWSGNLDSGIKFGNAVNNPKLGNIGRELITNNGSKAYGWSNGVNDGDYLKKITFDNKTYNKQTNGTYAGPLGEDLPFTIKGFGKNNLGIQNYDLPTEFNNIDAKQYYTNPNELNNGVGEVTKILLGTSDFTDEDKEKIKNVIGHLKHIALNSSSNNQEGIIAEKTLTALNKLIRDPKNSKLVLKSGGILKAQTGLKMNSYLEKYVTPTTQNVTNETSNKPRRDLGGT